MTNQLLRSTITSVLSIALISIYPSVQAAEKDYTGSYSFEDNYAKKWVGIKKVKQGIYYFEADSSNKLNAGGCYVFGIIEISANENVGYYRYGIEESTFTFMNNSLKITTNDHMSGCSGNAGLEETYKKISSKSPF